MNTLLLRSLKQARYSSENLGHFGLAFENYLHFTSPIRRYPDLVVHRAVRAMLQHRLSPTLKERMRSDFPILAQHASDKERQAEKAERDLARYFHARWAKDHIGERFHGTISGVTNFGVFVALPNGIEGLLHVSHLDDDYYMFLEDSMMLMGKSSRKKYRMGDRIEVRIHQSNPTVRQIDLVPADADVSDVTAEDAPKRSKAPKKLKTPVGGASDAPPLKDEPGPQQRRRATGGPKGRRGAEKGADKGADKGAGGKAADKAADKGGRKAPAKAAAGKGEAKAEPKKRASERDGSAAPAARSAKSKEVTVTEAVKPKTVRRVRRRLVFGDPGPWSR